jgi:hypothetical protein
VNDNEDEFEELTDEQLGIMVGTAADMGTRVERQLTLAWLRKNAADFLFVPGIDPQLQDYGTTVLELIADAIEDKEHWQHANLTQETMQ